MTAAVVDRDTRARDGSIRNFSVAAGALIYAGVIAVLNAGNLAKGTTAVGLVCVGVTRDRIDNTGGGAGAIRGNAHLGVFGPFANSAAGDLIAITDVSADCYIVDDQTVAKTSGGATRSIAGKVFDVSAEGVWVKFV
jgi:hypothetical protein